VCRPALNEERLKSIIIHEAYRTISVNDSNGPITIPMAQAIIRSLAVNAAKGNGRAQRLFTQLISSIERDKGQLHDEWLETAINYKVDESESWNVARSLASSPPTQSLIPTMLSSICRRARCA